MKLFLISSTFSNNPFTSFKFQYEQYPLLYFRSYDYLFHTLWTFYKASIFCRNRKVIYI